MQPEEQAAPEEKPPFVPRTRSTVDFILIVFVIMVAAIVFSIAVATLILALFTDKNVGPLFALLSDILTTIISALVGFIAGRGSVTENKK